MPLAWLKKSKTDSAPVSLNYPQTSLSAVSIAATSLKGITPMKTVYRMWKLILEKDFNQELFKCHFFQICISLNCV